MQHARRLFLYRSDRHSGWRPPWKRPDLCHRL